MTALGLSNVIELLAKYGADLNIEISGTNLSPLNIAAKHGHEQTYSALMTFGALVLFPPVITSEQNSQMCHKR